MNQKDASKYSIENMKYIKQTKIAGCYNCLSIFESINIKETTDNGETALCPKCGIDSVLLDTTPFSINSKTLSNLKRFWFK